MSANIAGYYPGRSFQTKDDDCEKERPDANLSRLEAMTTGNHNNRRLRVNEEIGDADVQLIDQQGKSLGVVKTQVAIQMAADAGSDLVEIAPDSYPPVCKFLDRKLYARTK